MPRSKTCAAAWRPGLSKAPRARKAALAALQDPRVGAQRKKLNANLEPVITFSGFGTSKSRLRTPRDLALSAAGDKLFITDSDNGRVQVFDTKGGHLGQLTAERMNSPCGVCVGPQGRIYVSDTREHSIFVFGEDGELLDSFGSRGLGPGQFLRPRDLRFSPAGELYVLDHGNHRGLVLDAKGELIDAFGARWYVRPAKFPDKYPAEEYKE